MVSKVMVVVLGQSMRCGLVVFEIKFSKFHSGVSSFQKLNLEDPKILDK